MTSMWVCCAARLDHRGRNDSAVFRATRGTHTHTEGASCTHTHTPHSHCRRKPPTLTLRPHTEGASRPPSHSALTLQAQAASYHTISACFNVTLRNRNRGNLVSLRLEKTATSNEKYARVLEGFVRL